VVARVPKAALASLLKDIRACKLCAADLPHGVRPVLRLSSTARLCIAGQAPGLRVHKSGIPYSDPSGDRLRAWLGVESETFYDETLVAILPMGFCFPGYDEAGADKPPLPVCARTWHERLFAAAPRFPLTLVVGAYAHRYHLKGRAKKNVTETVRSWQDYAPAVIPLPHPSWRNTGWLKKNPWFETDLLPYLRRRVREALS
jgi:uracil-DNA glycosylase